MIFLALKFFYLSSIKRVRNIFSNHCQAHSNSSHRPPFLLKTLAYFNQLENQGIGQCWERYSNL